MHAQSSFKLLCSLNESLLIHTNSEVKFPEKTPDTHIHLGMSARKYFHSSMLWCVQRPIQWKTHVVIYNQIDHMKIVSNLQVIDNESCAVKHNVPLSTDQHVDFYYTSGTLDGAIVFQNCKNILQMVWLILISFHTFTESLLVTYVMMKIQYS